LNKRVLIIGYPFVEANMGGVRLRRLARLLPRHGWEPVVLTYPPTTAQAPPAGADVRVEQVAAPDLASLYQRFSRLGRKKAASVPPSQTGPTARAIGLTTWINRWLIIPDKQMTWYRAAVRRGRELLRRETFSAIFASLDPRTSLLVAARLARESGVPCVLEYRDLWTGNMYRHLTQPTPLHRWLHAHLERKALRQASRVSTVCRGIADYLTRTYASVLRAPVELNYNFFDPEEFRTVGAEPPAARPFTISYTGAMYGSRTPHQFFEGMRAFIDRAGLSPAQFRFRWAGNIIGITDLDAVLERTGVRPYIDFLGQIPHREALRLLRQSDASLLLQAPDDAIHIPGKLFEAMGARVPLLALANPCEAAEIITRCRAGLVCPYTTEAVAEALIEFHRFRVQGARWEFQEAEVQRYSADAAVGRLAELLERAPVPSFP
jgi:glycosyltransferase involved in cell wall biosynthesis